MATKEEKSIDHEQLVAAHRELHAAHTALQAEHETLKSEHESLKESHAARIAELEKHAHSEHAIDKGSIDAVVAEHVRKSIGHSGHPSA